MSLTTNASLLQPPAMTTTVWTFVLGPSSGPRQMSVRPECNGYVGIRARVSVFPRHTRVRRLPMTVDGTLYLVYFDRERHKTDCAKATYVFVRLKHKGEAMDFSIELHFSDVMRMLSLSVFHLFCSLHKLTNTHSIEFTFEGSGAPRFPIADRTCLGSRHTGARYPLANTATHHTPYRTPTLPALSTLCIPHANDSGAFAPRLELLYEVLKYCDLRDQFRLAGTNRFNKSIIQDYIQLRKKMLALRFFNDSDSFYKMLSDWDSIISGWGALHLLLPAADTQWTPSSLEIYVPGCVYGEVRVWLNAQGYDITHVRPPHSNPSSFSAIKQAFVFTNKNCNVVVFASKTDAACAPIFRFQNTACMNYIGADRIFCAYPRLTFKYLCMVNPAPLFCNAFTIHDVDILREYETQGFTYIPWTITDIKSSNSPYRHRCLTDHVSMFVDTTNVPFGKTSAAEIAERYGVIDVHWTLGGKMTDSIFVHPRLTVIENCW